MSDRPSSFVRDWIAEHVDREPPFNGEIENLTAATITVLKEDAKEAGLDMSDPEMADDLLWDKVHAAIARAQGRAATIVRR